MKSFASFSLNHFPFTCGTSFGGGFDGRNLQVGRYHYCMIYHPLKNQVFVKPIYKILNGVGSSKVNFERMFSLKVLTQGVVDMYFLIKKFEQVLKAKVMLLETNWAFQVSNVNPSFTFEFWHVCNQHDMVSNGKKNTMLCSKISLQSVFNNLEK